MNMKTRLLTVMLMSMSGVAMAERMPPGPPRMGIDKLEILLDLDAYQKQEVQKILEAQRASMDAKREQFRNSETRPSFEEMQAEREAALSVTRAQLANVLSETQLKKFDVLTERPRMREGKGHDKSR